VDPREPEASIGKTKPQFPWGCLIAFLTVVIPTVWIHHLVSPPDWVDVTVGPFAKGVTQYCLVAEDSSGVGTLAWYHSKVIAFSEDPSLGGGYSIADEEPVPTVTVRWREARRYGVLVHREDNQWRILWLEPHEVHRPSPMRFIVGGGRAKMHLPAGDRGQVPPKDLLERLGFNEPPGG
jgi:hypothetical protein